MLVFVDVGSKTGYKVDAPDLITGLKIVSAFLKGAGFSSDQIERVSKSMTRFVEYSEL